MMVTKLYLAILTAHILNYYHAIFYSMSEIYMKTIQYLAISLEIPLAGKY